MTDPKTDDKPAAEATAEEPESEEFDPAESPYSGQTPAITQAQEDLALEVEAVELQAETREQDAKQAEEDAAAAEAETADPVPTAEMQSLENQRKKREEYQEGLPESE